MLKQIGLNFLTHPKLERWRARLPYALFTTILAYLFVLPYALIIALAQLLGYRGTDDISLSRSWLTLLLAPLGVGILFLLIAACGRISGYRPFKQRWRNVPRDEAREFSDHLRAAAENNRFVTVWRCHGDFVAVGAMHLESSELVHHGNHFPMRLSLFMRRRGEHQADVELKLANRTVVYWDTGERATCDRV